MIQLFPYNANVHREDWNKFVEESVNATFLLHRDYMDYHHDRFTDSSIVLTNKDKIVGLLPANASYSEGCVYSHQGLTYGGLIVSKDTSSTDVLEMLDAVRTYYKNNRFNYLIYKEIPYIYRTYPSNADQYWMFLTNAVLLSRAISSTVLLSEPLPFSVLRQRKVKKATNSALKVILDDYRLNEFWDILTDNLIQNHQTQPVHSLQEMQYLKSLFPMNIKFHSVIDSCDNIIGGCVVYESNNVAHIQYIAANEIGKDCCALDLLFNTLTEFYRQEGFKYLDYGISTEDGGKTLNKGLLFQKEGFGGRAVCYDTYKLKL